MTSLCPPWGRSGVKNKWTAEGPALPLVVPSWHICLSLLIHHVSEIVCLLSFCFSLFDHRVRWMRFHFLREDRLNAFGRGGESLCAACTWPLEILCGSAKVPGCLPWPLGAGVWRVSGVWTERFIHVVKAQFDKDVSRRLATFIYYMNLCVSCKSEESYLHL